jgi:hypothetical protein
MILIAKNQLGKYDVRITDFGDDANDSEEVSYMGLSNREILSVIKDATSTCTEDDDLYEEEDVHIKNASEDFVIDAISDHDYIIYSEPGFPAMFLNNYSKYAVGILTQIFDKGGLSKIKVTDNDILMFSFLVEKYAKANSDEVENMDEPGELCGLIELLKGNGVIDKYDTTGKIKRAIKVNSGKDPIMCQLEVVLLPVLAEYNRFKNC